MLTIAHNSWLKYLRDTLTVTILKIDQHSNKIVHFAFLYPLHDEDFFGVKKLVKKC